MTFMPFWHTSYKKSTTRMQIFCQKHLQLNIFNNGTAFAKYKVILNLMLN